MNSRPFAAAAAVTILAAAARRRSRQRRATPVPSDQSATPGESAAERREAVLVRLLEERPEPVLRGLATPITDRVHARMDDGDVKLVLARVDKGWAEFYASCDPATQRRVLLNFAAYYAVWPVLERTGLSHQVPPDDVHAMARGPIAAGGDPFIADLIFDALAHAGLEVAEGATVLDFGGSSGRVLRLIKAGRPELECLGCDPNAEAIAWAQKNLPMARFFVSPQRPPLELPEGSVDLVFAISIWSHFAEDPATVWLREMHRVVRPGGALLITTHSFDCLTTFLRRKHISPGSATAAAAAMVRGQHHFIDVFGPEGDWGVKDAGWGNAYLTVERLLLMAREDWIVRLNWPGGLDQVQDVIVLERR